MKKIFIIAIIGTSLLFQNCDTKEKQEKTEIKNDSIVTETVIIDTIVTNDPEVIVEDLTKENENTPIEKTTTVTKITTKEPGKVVTQETTETKVNEDIKVEVETKVVVTEQPKKIVETETPVKVVETETPVKVVVQVPKVTTNISDWKIPTKYQTMKNTTDPEVDLAIGKSLYTKHCKSCHGNEGYGDGPKADEMKGDLGDFSSEEFQSQSDGALFYKTTIGRDDMPAFDKKLSLDEDRWLIVNYMRTLAE